MEKKNGKVCFEGAIQAEKNMDFENRKLQVHKQQNSFSKLQDT